jgi:tetratricopeptide (TPR) repeat protein
VYVVLSLVYKEQGKFAEVEQILNKAVEIDFKHGAVHTGLGKIYYEQKMFAEAEQAFKKAIELNPQSDCAYGGLARVYGEMGKDELFQAYTEKADKLRDKLYNPVTIDNYHKLKQILDKRKIKLVCVQYPMRSIQPLKKIFKDDENVIFVDNERIFKEVVREEGYNIYFRDMFGGDFGHCTQKGNRLLANNIANTILKEIFGK